MTIARTLIAAGFALAAAPALAAFQLLPTAGTLRIDGSNNPAADPLFIPTGTANGDGTYQPPSFLQLLAENETDIELPDEDDGELEEVGEFFDSVFRDTSDGTLVFASRIVLEDEGEINDIFRSGFYGYQVLAAWTFSTDFDLRMSSTARSNTGLLDPDEFDPDVVNMRTDINVEEGNPQSGLFFIKVAAPGYIFKEDAIRVFQAGEEGQDPFSFVFGGYVPTPVPEPSTYAMLLGGLGLLAFAAKRRRTRAS